MIPQPGRVPEAINWLKEKEAQRKSCGQISQILSKSLTDPKEFLFIQIWESKESYDKWRSSEERAALAKERQALLAHEPILFYEVL
jgi:quinol monooxygenase YgiN